MADELTGDQLSPQSTPSAEGSEEVQVDDQVQVENEEQPAQPEASSESQENEEQSSDGTGEQSGQEAKPTRVERRIHDLLSKVKEVSNNTSEKPVSNEESLFTEQEKQDLEQGIIDPDTLIKRVQNTVQSEVQKAIQIDRITQQYQSAINEHTQDLESVKDIDPDLEAEAVAEYEAINYQINPLTGQREFVPAVKLSEIVAKIENRATKIATKMAEKIAEGNLKHLQEVSSSQAVPTNGSVGGSQSVTPETTNFSDFEKAYSSK